MTRYAIVESGGQQFLIEENSIFQVERISSADSKELKLDHVLFLRDNGAVKIGQPYVDGASVLCEILGEVKQPKVISFKFKRRQGYRRRVGHRQILTTLKVKSIQIGSQ